MNEDNNKAGGFVGIFVLAFFIGMFFGGDKKYEDMTAEEWADEYYAENQTYQEFRSCVEDYDSFDIETQLSYGGVFYYCE